jgi:transposase
MKTLKIHHSYSLYFEVICKMKSFDKMDYRFKMVQYARKEGISQAARLFNTSRNTIRKWLKRFEKEGMSGLKDQSRAPKHSPNKLSQEVIDKLMKIREKYPTFSTKRLAAEGLLPCSHETARKVYAKAGKTRKKKRKKRLTSSVAKEFKEKLKPFELIILDTKHLYDLPVYNQYRIALGLPKYQYTARDVKSGLLFTAYSNELSLTNNTIFVKHIIKFLQENGVDLNNVTFQFDNGSENIGSVRRKEYSTLEKFLVDNGVKANRIPPRRWIYNADVETLHGRIEEEFLESIDVQISYTLFSKNLYILTITHSYTINIYLLLQNH